MSFSREIKTIFAIDGEKKYSDAIEEINKKQKVLTAEMKASGAAFDLNGDKQGKLKMQTESLAKQIELQRKKIDEAKNAMESYSKQEKVDAETANELKIQYYNAEAALSKMQGTLIKTNQDLAIQESKLKQAGDAAQAAGKKMQGIGEGMNKVGSGMTAGITVPVMAAAAGLAALVVKTTSAAGELQEMSDKTGLSAERLQELKYVGADLGFELESITGSQSKLTKAMASGKDESSAQAKAFKTLKVDAVDPLTGQLRDSNVVFGEVVDALGNMTNPTERDALSLTLLGKSALELNPLIKAGSTEINRLTEEAHKNGAVMSNESVKSMDSFGDAIEKAKISIGTAAGEITVELLPTLEKLLPIVEKDIVPAIRDGAKVIGEWADAFSDLDPAAKKTVLTLAGLIVVAGPLLKTVGTAMTVTGGLTSGIGKLTSSFAAHKIAMATAAAATDGLAASETAAGVAGTGMLAALGPIALAVGLYLATAAVVGKLSEESRLALEETTALTLACEDSAKAFKDSSQEIDTNAAVTQSLSDKLFALSDKENKSNVEKAEMTSLVSQLNKQMPELNLTIDEQTGALNKNKKSVDELIKSKLAEIKLQANEERVLELYKENVELTNKRTEAQKRNEQALKDNSFTSAWGTEVLFDLNSAYGNSCDELNKLDKQLATNAESIDVASEAMGGAVVASIPYTDSILGTGKVVTETNAVIVDSAQETTQLAQEQLDAQQTAREEWAAAIEQATKDYYAAMGTIDDEGIKQSETTAAKAKANIEQQTLDFQNYNANLEALSARVTPTVLAQLKELGPQYSSMLGELNGYTDAELQAWVNTWTNKGSLARAAADATFAAIYAAYGDPYTTFYGLGQATIDGLIAGMQANVGGAYTAAEEAAKGIAAAARRNPTTKKPIPKYASGIKYVPEDQIALIHKGEAVLTAAENPYTNSNLVSSPDVTFDGSQYNMSGLENSIRSSNAITTKLAAAGGKVAGSAQAAGGNATGGSSQAAESGQLVHSGKITVEGVNNKGDLVGVTQIIMDQLRFENMMSGRG